MNYEMPELFLVLGIFMSIYTLILILHSISNDGVKTGLYFFNIRNFKDDPQFFVTFYLYVVVQIIFYILYFTN